MLIEHIFHCQKILKFFLKYSKKKHVLKGRLEDRWLHTKQVF